MHSRGLYSGKRNISERSVPLPFFIFLFSTNTYRGATMGFPEGSVGKESACNAGDIGDADLIPGSGISPGGWCDNSLQYSCWEKTMDIGAWWALVAMVTESHN